MEGKEEPPELRRDGPPSTRGASRSMRTARAPPRLRSRCSAAPIAWRPSSHPQPPPRPRSLTTGTGGSSQTPSTTFSLTSKRRRRCSSSCAPALAPPFPCPPLHGSGGDARLFHAHGQDVTPAAHHPARRSPPPTSSCITRRSATSSTKTSRHEEGPRSGPSFVLARVPVKPGATASLIPALHRERPAQTRLELKENPDLGIYVKDLTRHAIFSSPRARLFFSQQRGPTTLPPEPARAPPPTRSASWSRAWRTSTRSSRSGERTARSARRS